ncbi:MAG: DUF4404 family protein [Kiritimatiellae bacterium]|nr:DUF4404 family protein [Kiritimatiellia bacterium]MDD4735139.1 DUF4404 family protein [Kiritimatiellia bacterium]
MPKEKLKQSLNRLNEEINQLPDQADNHRTQLKTLHKQASAFLADNAEDQPDHLPLLDEFREMAQRLELSHPDLTDGINQVLNALSNMGI